MTISPAAYAHWRNAHANNFLIYAATLGALTLLRHTLLVPLSLANHRLTVNQGVVGNDRLLILTLNMFVERYRRIPGRLAFATAAIASFGVAVIAGILGAIAAMYVYDLHDVTKGDGFVVGMGGLFCRGHVFFRFRV